MSIQVLKNDNNKICPEADANLFSKWTYSWLNRLMMLGKKKPLVEEDIYELDPNRKAKPLVDELENAWKIECQENENPTLLNAIYRHYFRRVAPIGIYRFISDMGTNFSPILLRYLISYVQSTNQPNPPSIGYGISYAIGLFLVQIYITVVQNRYFLLSLSQGLEFRTAFVGAIFRKATRLSAASRQEFNSGKVTNLVSTDVQRIEAFIGFGHVIWTAPVQFLIITTLLIITLGPAALGGIGILIILLPIQRSLMMKLQTLRKSVAPVTDSRVKLIQEIITGIRVIKFFTWELPFMEQIEKIRQDEIGLVRKRSFLQAFVYAIAFSVPAFSTAAGLILYGAFNPLEPARAFAALALFNQLRYPLMFLPMAILNYVEFKIALVRIQELFLAPELDSKAEFNSENDFAIVVENGEFVWEKLKKSVDKKTKSIQDNQKQESQETQTGNDDSSDRTQAPVLSNINFQIPKGKLVAVVGSVGSGKSSLLNSFVGETKRVSGRVTFSGSIGYCPQQAWIQNATIKDNILFGQEFNSEKYQKVIHDCALQRDLEIFEDGDMTEIGERGINLSGILLIYLGGQKQRINLARLLYFGPEIVLMDDPLSAVDAHVGKHLFEQCIKKAMHDKTRVLVTHQLHFIPQVDYILVMKNGEIAEQGTFQKLMNDNGEFYQLMKSYGNSTGQKKEESENNETDILKGNNDGLSKKPDHNAKQVMEKEDRSTGSVKSSIWKTYFYALGGWAFVPLFLVAILFVQVSRVGTDAWLVAWSNNVFPSFTLAIYIIIYVGWALLQTFASYLMGLLFAYFGTIAARKLHKNSFEKLLYAPVSFFDSTPLGRIINRFSKDQDAIDNSLMDAFRMFIGTLMDTISVFCVIITSTPLFAIPLLPVGILYYFIQSFYRATSRELKRIEAITRSPLYAHIGETLDGISTIRAYREEDHFIHSNESMIDNTNAASFLLISSSRWMSLRLESLGATLVLSAALFGLLAAGTPWFTPALFGLSMTYSLQVTGSLNWCIRQFTECEIAMNAVERVAYYGQNLPQEGVAIETVRPSPSWPDRGSIKFNNVSMRYNLDLPLVLKNLVFECNPGEKVAFVGRTGSGKSSIMNVLFRMVEFSGSIEIDDVDTTKIGLRDLRFGLGIIPQDPVLFSGPFRRNLDPFNNYTDAEIWEALEKASIKKKVSESGGLDGTVLEGGENLSVGERQLICLARALLRKPKILVMDEATANVDYETDSIIQECIRNDLKSSTILTIAHRLNTIIDYDRVLVLDHGSIVEFASPKDLLQKPNGVFLAMAEETGPENMSNFRKILGIQ